MFILLPVGSQRIPLRQVLYGLCLSDPACSILEGKFSARMKVPPGTRSLERPAVLKTQGQACGFVSSLSRACVPWGLSKPRLSSALCIPLEQLWDEFFTPRHSQPRDCLRLPGLSSWVTMVSQGDAVLRNTLQLTMLPHGATEKWDVQGTVQSTHFRDSTELPEGERKGRSCFGLQLLTLSF